MAGPQPIDKFMDVLIELGNTHDRAAAILAGAFVENYLAWAILSRLRDPLATDVRNRLFENGPLSECAAKIDFGFALSLYGTGARADLITINRIRNRFAHRLDISKFEHREIAQFCEKLYAPKKGIGLGGRIATDSKEQFMDTVYHLSSGLSLMLRKRRTLITPHVLDY